jgi:hypothetical protein
MSPPSLGLKSYAKQALLVVAPCWFLAWFMLQPSRWRQHISPVRQLPFAGTRNPHDDEL